VVEVDDIGLEKGNKDSIWVFEVELACSCELGSDSSPGNSNLSQDAPT
jgi:hypothetical protein